MSKKFEGEVPPQKHEQGKKLTLDFKEVTKSILNEGRMSINKSDTDGHPKEAREMLGAVTAEDVKKAILERADFSETMTWYVDDLNEKGRPTSMSGEKSDKFKGVNRVVFS